MHYPLTFHSCLKPATSPQVTKMYNDVQNFSLFSIDLECHTVNFSSHPPKKIRINVLFKMFPMIGIDKQSLTTSSEV